jgi:GABA permease
VARATNQVVARVLVFYVLAVFLIVCIFNAILLSVSVGFLSVIFDAISPNKVFLFLVNSSCAMALFCYVLIAVAELRMRRRMEAEDPDRLTLRMWLFPWLTYASIAGMVAVIIAMAFVEDVRSQLIPSFLSLAVVLGAACLRYRQPAASDRRRTVKEPGAYGVPRAG